MCREFHFILDLRAQLLDAELLIWSSKPCFIILINFLVLKTNCLQHSSIFSGPSSNFPLLSSTTFALLFFNLKPQSNIFPISNHFTERQRRRTSISLETLRSKPTALTRTNCYVWTWAIIFETKCY